MKTTSYYLLMLILLLVADCENCKRRCKSRVLPHPSEGKGGEIGMTADEKIAVGNQVRDYRLVVPKDISPHEPVPILFAFHAYHGAIDISMHAYTKLDQLAHKERFILVYPNTIEPRWSLEKNNNPDIIFFDTLLRYLSSRYNVDFNKVYATGMSNGAYFINILASQRSETIAAIALHSGELPLLEISAQRKYPVMIIHGTEDKIVKVSEGRKMRDMYRKEGHEVIYVEISDLGHTWAWEKHNINQKIWDFFISHPFYAK